jgi:mannan polymerase II complex ANP1 subunit
MEQERIAREKEEQQKKLKEQKMKEEFGDATGQWEKDKKEMKEQQQQSQRSGSSLQEAGSAEAGHNANGA